MFVRRLHSRLSESRSADPRPGQSSLRRAWSGLGAAGWLLSLTLTATGCSVVGESDPPAAEEGPDEVVLVTHESFVLPDDLKAEFEQQSGLTLTIRASGDAGTLTNKLVLTQGSPTGDVAYGIDNTFASRALDADVFAPYVGDLPIGADAYRLRAADGSPEVRLAPVDQANVCINVDTTWFARKRLDPPSTLADLIDPAYRDLLVLPGAATSSTGLAFLLATIAEYGAGWEDYWAGLMANGAKLTAGWSDAYYVDFTQGGEDGKRPIVLSYDSSPAFTVSEKDPEASRTEALLDTCFQQVEYAGILTGASNPEGGNELVTFLLSEEVQAALPESMYVFPVRSDVALPTDWARFAVQPTAPYQVDPAEITARRDEWLQRWNEITTR
jgi:thiamine transport system substrate-binding protein